MRCERIKKWMGDRLDGCLDPERTREMNAHLGGCEACRREWEELRQTVALVRDLPPIMPPVDLLPSVRRRLARRQKSPLVVFWRVLSLPQTRVAIAAAFVALVGVYGWRTIMAGPNGALDNNAAGPAAPPYQRDVRPGRAGPPDPPKDASGSQTLYARKELATDSPLADKLTLAETARSPEGETKGRIWGRTGAVGGRKSKADSVDSLRVGEESALAGAPGNRPAGSLATSVAAAPAPAISAPPAQQRDREIVLAASDAPAVRKILGQYVVRRDDKKEEAASFRAKHVESDILITGWVPAARYAQLLANLQSVGTVQSRQETRGKAATGDTDAAGPGKRPRTENDDEELLFVRITLVPPVK